MTILPSPARQLATAITKALLETEDQKEAFWKAYAAKAEAHERPIIRVLRKLFGEQEAEVLKRLENASKPEDALFDQKEAEEEFKEALVPHLREVLASAIEDAMNLVAPPQPHTDSIKADGLVSGDALIWLMDRAAELVVGINQVTREALRTTLMDGFAEGESIPKLADRVKSVFGVCKESRAIKIARTEVIAASNEGALEGYKASEVVEKSEFFAALDERLCPECEGLHGNVYPLKEAHGLIPVHPQCRCVWLPVI
jgi:SPP1 gp7 family putative phage head morphogenesis protein